MNAACRRCRQPGVGFAVPAAVVFLSVVLGVIGGSEPVEAHSFLVGTSPAQGERLASSPRALVLVFSERIDLPSAIIEVRSAGGQPVSVGETEIADDGLEVRVVVGDPIDDGIYVVAWRALSGVDGHGSSGEFAFAVGDVSGTVPALVSSSSTDGLDVVAAWVFFVGLALAAGVLVLEVACRGEWPISGAMVLRAGLVVALAGGLARLLADGVDELELWLCVQAVAVALVAVALPRARVLVGAAVLVAAGLWASRGHGAGSEGVIGWLVDVVHLSAAAAWAGSLLLAVMIGWRLRGGERPWLPFVRSYARVALVLVTILGSAGVVGALLLLPSWRALWETGYGRLVAIKAGLFAVAVVLAALGRWRGLPHGRSGVLRRSMTVEATVLVAALVVAALLVNAAPPSPAVAAEQLLGPAPLEGAVSRDAGLAGQLNVDVAADGDRLDVRVFGPSGPLRGTTVEIATTGPDGRQADLVPRPCGPGCFTQRFDLAEGATSVRVVAAAPDWIGGSYDATLLSPPGQPAGDMLDDVVARMREVPELTVTETVTSGPGSNAAPGTFTTSGRQFIAGEPYAAANVDDVRLVSGEPAWLVLYVAGSQIYAALELDSSGRLASARLVSPGHEITRTFSYPDE